jgi:hypothetical protein
VLQQLGVRPQATHRASNETDEADLDLVGAVLRVPESLAGKYPRNQSEQEPYFHNLIDQVMLESSKKRQWGPLMTDSPENPVVRDGHCLESVWDRIMDTRSEVCREQMPYTIK